MSSKAEKIIMALHETTGATTNEELVKNLYMVLCFLAWQSPAPVAMFDWYIELMKTFRDGLPSDIAAKGLPQ